MKLSIITINLNNKEGLKKTIDSIINQTYKDFEWIVIDGDSTDGSKELIQLYTKHITYWVSEKDNGIYHAMNKGIRVSQGEYLQFLNSGDCLYSNDIIEKIFSNEHDGDIIYGNAIYTYKNNKHELKKFNQPLSCSYFISGKVINHQAAFIKKILFNNNLYNEDFRIVSDWEFWIKQSLRNIVFQYIDITIINFDYTGITSKTTQLQKDEKQLVINNLPPLLKKDLDELFYLRNKINEGHIKIIDYYFQKGIFFQKIINMTIHLLNWSNHMFNKK